MQSMPEQYPTGLGARQARSEHGQMLLGIPKELVTRWQLQRGRLLYWSLSDATHATVTVLDHPDLGATPTPPEQTAGVSHA